MCEEHNPCPHSETFGPLGIGWISRAFATARYYDGCGGTENPTISGGILGMASITYNVQGSVLIY